MSAMYVCFGFGPVWALTGLKSGPQYAPILYYTPLGVQSLSLAMNISRTAACLVRQLLGVI
jgi:hypothetical protein